MKNASSIQMWVVPTYVKQFRAEKIYFSKIFCENWRFLFKSLIMLT